MAFDFPNAPVAGEIFEPPGGPVYQWSGSAWYLVKLTERLWVPTDLVVKPYIMLDHHTMVQWDVRPWYTPNEGFWVGSIYLNSNTGYGVEMGKYGHLKTIGLDNNSAVKPEQGAPGATPFPPIRAGTAAVLGIGSNLVAQGYICTFAGTTMTIEYPPLGEDVPEPDPNMVYPHGLDFRSYWHVAQADCTAAASGNGDTWTPGFRSNDPAATCPAGWHSQFWQVGPVNAYRRDGLDMTAIATNAYNNQTTSPVTSAPPGVMGNYNMVSEMCTMYVSFYAFWDVVPPLADLQLLEGWAHHDLGLEAALPADHPYKAGPPMFRATAPIWEVN